MYRTLLTNGQIPSRWFGLAETIGVIGLMILPRDIFHQWIFFMEIFHRLSVYTDEFVFFLGVRFILPMSMFPSVSIPEACGSCSR